MRKDPPAEIYTLPLLYMVSTMHKNSAAWVLPKLFELDFILCFST